MSVQVIGPVLNLVFFLLLLSSKSSLYAPDASFFNVLDYCEVQSYKVVHD